MISSGIFEARSIWSISPVQQHLPAGTPVEHGADIELLFDPDGKSGKGPAFQCAGDITQAYHRSNSFTIQQQGVSPIGAIVPG
jgi:hypothetical protein